MLIPFCCHCGLLYSPMFTIELSFVIGQGWWCGERQHFPFTSWAPCLIADTLPLGGLSFFVLCSTTSFPGSLFFPSPGAREREREREGLSLSLAPGDGKKRDPGNEVALLCCFCFSLPSRVLRVASKRPMSAPVTPGYSWYSSFL